MKRRAGPGAYPSSRAVSAPAFLSFAGLAIIPATGLVVVIAVHLDRRIRCHWFKAVNAHLVTATAARATIARARIRKVGRLPLVTIGALKRVLWQLVSHLGFLAPDACLLAIGLVFVGGAAAAKTEIVAAIFVRASDRAGVRPEVTDVIRPRAPRALDQCISSTLTIRKRAGCALEVLGELIGGRPRTHYVLVDQLIAIWLEAPYTSMLNHASALKLRLNVTVDAHLANAVVTRQRDERSDGQVLEANLTRLAQLLPDQDPAEVEGTGHTVVAQARPRVTVDDERRIRSSVRIPALYPDLVVIAGTVGISTLAHSDRCFDVRTFAGLLSFRDHIPLHEVFDGLSGNGVELDGVQGPLLELSRRPRRIAAHPRTTARVVVRR